MIRLVNRLLALLIGLALAAGGALVIIEGIWTWTGSGFVWIPGGQWLSSFETTPWSAPAVIGISVAVAVVGLVLLLVEIRPQRHRVVPYPTTTGGDWLLLRRSTEAHLQRRVAAQVPTTPIRARLKPGARAWSLKIKARAARSTAPELERVARAELEALHAPDASRVRVKATGATRT